jgi:hypothetical protein
LGAWLQPAPFFSAATRSRNLQPSFRLFSFATQAGSKTKEALEHQKSTDPQKKEERKKKKTRPRRMEGNLRAMHVTSQAAFATT